LPARRRANVLTSYWLREIAVTFAPGFFIDALKIVLIDLTLAGDNALVIALAVRSLPQRQRRIGSALGAAVAVALRAGITFAAVKLLDVPYIKLAGGAFVLYIAVKVFVDAEGPENKAPLAGEMWRAVWYIVVADITMSTDNVLAIAGASHDSLALILFGLGLSIPLVVLSSNLWVAMMNRYPWTLYLGAAILGQVGAEMMLTDTFVTRTVHPSQTIIYVVEVLAVVVVLAVSRLLSKNKKND
jgi:YjbE family integral membrane protein